jgi:alginate O-acetyltransferase complex protein AlgI
MNLSLDLIWNLLQYDKDNRIIFTSGLFLFFFLGFMLIYWLLQHRTTLRLLWVTVFSLYFYYKCAGWFWILHVVIVVADYSLAILIERAQQRSLRRFWLFGSLVLNLGILVYFKYTGYFAEIWNLMATPGHYLPVVALIPLVGVSFFTFQSLSYTIDVYKGEIKALDNILDYAFFVTFFPQMVAGPIVRAADFLPQIRRPLMVTRDDLGRAVYLFCIGMFKKVVIADYLGANFVEAVFTTPERYTGLENLMAVYGFAMQIYGDFSGYSDMAIAIALAMGFHFPVNFDVPYTSLSITEFWRRWHISLSSWLRDYLYIPLGGNRASSLGTWLFPGLFFGITLGMGIWQGTQHGSWWVLALFFAAIGLFGLPYLWRRDPKELATGFNLFATMLLGGLWHGAANRYLIWGALHGLGLAAERWWKVLFPGPIGPIRKVLGGLLTFHFVCLCWIFFRARDLATVQAILGQIFYDFNGQVFGQFVVGYAPTVCVMLLGYLLHFMPRKAEDWSIHQLTRMPLFAKALVVTAFIMLIMQVKSSGTQDFIYFEF